MSGIIDINSIFTSAVAQYAGGPGGLLASEVMKQIAGNVIDQVIQQLPISEQQQHAMQAAFHAQIGDVPGTVENLQSYVDNLAPFLSPADQGSLDRGIQELMAASQRFFNEAMQSVQESGGSEETCGAARSRGGDGDFFSAMATALGQALQEQANRVESLANELSDAVSAANGTEGDERADAQNEIMLIQTQLSSEALRLNFMSSGIHTALTQIGQALANLGSAN